MLAHPEGPPAEGHDRAPVPADRDHEPVAEAVHGPSFRALDDEAALEEDVDAVPRVEEVPFQPLPLRRREAEPEALRRGCQHLAGLEVRARLRCGGSRELGPEVVAGQLVHRQQRLPLALRGRVAGRIVRLRHPDAEALRQGQDRVRKGQALLELDELDDVAAGPAAEAVEEPPVPVDGERRRLLGVERAEPLVAGARPAQRDDLLHDLHDVGLRLQIGDEARRKARHGSP